jgi:outer membrane protein TolC
MQRALVMVVLGWAALAFGGLSVAVPAPGQDGLDGPLTLEGAVRIFRARGFDLLLADAAVEVARAGRVQASAVANPQLSGGIGHSFTYSPACPGCSATAWNAGLSEQGALFDVLSGKRGLRISVAEAALAAARLDRVDAQRTLEQEVKRQYVEAVYAGDALALAAAVEAAFAETLELNRTRWRAGAISEVEVLRVEVAMLGARQEVTRSRQAVEDARAALAFLLGARGPGPRLPARSAPAAVRGCRRRWPWRTPTRW